MCFSAGWKTMVEPEVRFVFFTWSRSLLFAFNVCLFVLYVAPPPGGHDTLVSCFFLSVFLPFFFLPTNPDCEGVCESYLPYPYVDKPLHCLAVYIVSLLHEGTGTGYGCAVFWISTGRTKVMWTKHKIHTQVVMHFSARWKSMVDPEVLCVFFTWNRSTRRHAALPVSVPILHPMYHQRDTSSAVTKLRHGGTTLPRMQ